MTKRPILLLAVVAVVAAIGSGCGSANGLAVSTTTSTENHPAPRAVGAAALKTAARAAIRGNLQLSLYVLWHNRIPSWAARSTGGPALTALRSAAAIRRQQGIQIKNLSGSYRIVSVTLAPSYATAMAVVLDKRRVAPYKAGHRLGKAISGDEHSRIQLHRVGNTTRFIVWRVSPIK